MIILIHCETRVIAGYTVQQYTDNSRDFETEEQIAL